jgi:hypothetical protein
MIEARKITIEYCNTLSEKISIAGISTDIEGKVTDILNLARVQQLVVPVVGAFSSGKSTMINSLLGTNALPVAITPETSLATELHYSPENFIEAVKENGEIDRYHASEINKVTENADKYQYARLYLNNERLREIEPLVLVDMPGFDSPLDLHNKAILAYLDRGCYYIVLSSVEDGTITKSLERRLREIEGYGRDFSFFLSKSNLRPNDTVDKLVSHYQTQIEDMLGVKATIAPFGNSADEILRCLKSIDVNKVFLKIYRDWLLDICNDIITGISLQLNISKKNAEAVHSAVREMENGIEKLRKKADSDIEDMKRRYSVTLVNDLVSAVGSALEDALEELTGIAVTGNNDKLTRNLNEIIRVALTSSIQEKLNDITKQISVDFSQSLQDLDKVMKDLDLDNNYLGNITEKVGSTLTMLDRLIASNAPALNDYYDGRESLMIENKTENKTENKFQAGMEKLAVARPMLNMGYKAASGAGLAAVAVNPIIGIIIVFLPEIIETIAKLIGGDPKEKQKEALRSKFSGEIFPSIKRKLREEIPGILNEQVKNMIQNVSGQYEEQIKQQSAVINSQIAQKSGNIEEDKEKEKRLNSVLADVKKIDGEIRSWGK